MTQKITKNNQRIAIIGAGPAGLSCAWFLQKMGYHRVTVFEKLGRVGGLCKSLTVEGKSFDIGANYLTWDYTETLRIAKELKIETYKEKPYTSIKIDQCEHSAKYQSIQAAVMINPFSGKKVLPFKMLITAIKYLRLRYQLSALIDCDDYLQKINKETQPGLCCNFADWLKMHDLDDLGTVFQFPITVMGYGELEEIAAPYALRYMSLKTVIPMVVLPLPIIGKIFALFLPWPRRFKRGFQRFWQEVSWQTNVRLNADIKEIIRRVPNDKKGDKAAAISIIYSYPQQNMNNEERVEKTQDFDQLILACPLNLSLLKAMKIDLSEEEKRLFRQIKVMSYCMTTFWVDNMIMPQPVAPVLPIPAFKNLWPTAVARQFQNDNNYFTQFYTRSPVQELSPLTIVDQQDIIAQVHQLVGMLGGTIKDRDRCHTFDRFTYFQHVSVKDMENGFYADFAELQGKNNTYYVGGATDFELVEPIVRYSKYLTHKFF